MFIPSRHFTRKFSLLTLFAMMLSGCNPSLRITGMDISNMYAEHKDNNLSLSYVYHINDSISELGIVLPSGLILPDPVTKTFTQKGKLLVEIIGAGKQVSLVDSASFSIADTSINASFISQTWAFKAPLGMDYFVKGTYSIPGMPEDYLLLEYVNKLNRFSQPWYRFRDETGQYLTGNISNVSSNYSLVTEDTNSRNIHARHFAFTPQAATPPFIEPGQQANNYQPDTAFLIELKDGRSGYFSAERTGIYFFPADPEERFGPVLLRMDHGFPKISMHQQMLEALRYITSAAEYRQLSLYEDPKTAVDSFWLANAGHEERALELIRNYYTRVENANKLYTSCTEGWKTDRGMIYIVVGKPDLVFRSFEQEVWIYGEYDDPGALRFFFDKVQNPFSDNDYQLVRDPEYKTIWYQYVQNWRR